MVPGQTRPQQLKSTYQWHRNIAGERYGLLVAIEMTQGRLRGRVVWRCECDCGQECFVSSQLLQMGDRKSCGCLQRETRRKNLRNGDRWNTSR